MIILAITIIISTVYGIAGAFLCRTDEIKELVELDSETYSYPYYIASTMIIIRLLHLILLTFACCCFECIYGIDEF